MKVETYSNALDATPKGPEPLDEIIEAIRTDESLRKQIEAIRAEPDPKKQDTLKKDLAAFQASASLGGNGRSVIQHSGLLQIDVDCATDKKPGITRERAVELRDSWEYDPHIVAAFLSARGGAKV